MDKDPEQQGTDAQTPPAAEDMAEGVQAAAGDTAAEAAGEAPLDDAGTPGIEPGVSDVTEQDLVGLLEDARTKADDHWNQLMRLRAEMDNLSKRHQRDLENAHKFALERFVNELLAVWDSLELGHQAASDDAADVAKLREGTELTLKLMGDVMAKFGVVQLNPLGEPFNPEFHQAIATQPAGEQPPNSVANVVQRGYTLNGRLVRPAMVVVAQGGAPGVSEQA